MNANELADKLQMDKARALLYVDTVVEAANMLRLQADRISELEKDRDRLFKAHSAEMVRADKQADYIAQLEKGLESSIAMNKAQAERQVKELTDEEIIAVGNAVVNHIDSNEGWIEFARAILRKAQEK